MKRIFAVIFFLASAALAQGPHVIGDNVSMETTGTGYGKAAIITNAYEPIEFYTDKTLRGSISGAGVFSWAGGINLPNDTFLTADTTAGLVGGISLLKGAATSDNTRLNCNNAKKIEFAENDVVGTTLDPSTNGFTFASPAELGTVGSVTDGISRIALTDGTDSWSFVPGGNILLWAASTSDGTDDQYTSIAGGGAAASSRGGIINIVGNDFDMPAARGAVRLYGGDSASTATSGAVEFYPRGALSWSVLGGGALTQDATNGGNIVMAKASTSIINGAAAIAADASAVGVPRYFSSGAVSAIYHHGSVDNVAPLMYFMKSRKTDGTADTIVNDADNIGNLYFYGADGAAFQPAARIAALVDGTPGAGDMPGRLVFSVSPDGSATLAEAMRISQDRTVTFASTGSLGWSVVDGSDNTACTSQCTSAAVFGFNLAAGATAPVIVGPADNTADICLCAGAS